MTSPSRLAASLQLGALSLLSAFLLFQVQPMISKFILPWFGGGPGVWTTCMLFFQVVLFAGYAYAHGLMHLPQRWRGIIHGTLVLAAAVTLPIAPGPRWKPSGAEDPVLCILLLLLGNVALPYFVLSSTSPLVQVWFSRGGDDRSPWRLYALSNLGSLAALLTYPFFFEPRWGVMEQTWMWSGAFVMFALLSWLGAYGDWKNHKASAPNSETAPEQSRTPLWRHRILWLLLPAIASVLLLGATNHLCQDVAAIPFLWVLPLSLYLLTFIICFEHERWYVRALWALPAMALLFAAATHTDLEALKWWHLKLTPDFRAEIALVCAAVFLGCMVCHGELTRLKPDPRHLTEFYLFLSAGGAMGGLFVSLAAPRLFKTYLEWPGVLLLTFGIAAFSLLCSAWTRRNRWLRFGLAGLALVPALLGIWFIGKWAFITKPRLEIVRNFYGVVSVEENFDDDGAGWLTLYHGSIIHGYQYLAEESRNQPLSYYGNNSGIGLALLTLKNRKDARVGVVGMGSGTVASYGEKGHVYRFYDINPGMVRIARERFHFLEDLEQRGGKVEVAMGDARQSLEREESQQFDVMLLDAFSGDAVPVHLLTREAFEVYRRHLKPNGIIAVHVSNRYLKLTPVVEKVAAELGWQTTRISTELDRFNEITDYVMVTNDGVFLLANPNEADESEAPLPVSLWTDRRHNLFEIMIK